MVAQSYGPRPHAAQRGDPALQGRVDDLTLARLNPQLFFFGVAPVRRSREFVEKPTADQVFFLPAAQIQTKIEEIPVFTCWISEFARGEWFAADCVIRQAAPSFKNPRSEPPTSQEKRGVTTCHRADRSTRKLGRDVFFNWPCRMFFQKPRLALSKAPSRTTEFTTSA